MTGAVNGELCDGALFGMGNPLLDISCHGDQELLDKYDMKPNDAILAEERHMPLYDEMSVRFKVHHVAGGATQNTLRAAQWVLARPGTCTFVGCVGDDVTSQTLEKVARADGVNTVYQVNKEVPTGRCAVIVTDNGKCRSLNAHLAAANCFTVDHLEVPEHWKLVQQARFFYVSGFFLTVSIESILKVAAYACSANLPFMMNLSAPFLSHVFSKQQMTAFPYVDILFGNESEAAAFSEGNDFNTDNIHEVALKAAALPKHNTERSRMVVLTQGELEVIVAMDGEVQSFSVPKIDNVMDTNGAGDAFVGGFLSQYIQNKPLADCVQCAIYVAQEVIQREGCTFPSTCKYWS